PLIAGIESGLYAKCNRLMNGTMRWLPLRPDRVKQLLFLGAMQTHDRFQAVQQALHFLQSMRVERLCYIASIASQPPAASARETRTKKPA
ncbi:MAG TPA: hypothetical protein VL635_10500, partial [Trinickia sp.]|nr:hypothetical protein [Trinickia sp.]